MDAFGISSWIIIGYPLLFLFGWLASRFDYAQIKIDNRESPKAYFKGLNLLLDEQQDEAIDAFIEAVQNDPDTSDLHFALGRLFRKRGEFQRAIRIHQHLLSRGDLSTSEHERAQYALAQDYLKAGIINLAQQALESLLSSSYEMEARRALVGIYERSREWQKASEMAAALRARSQETPPTPTAEGTNSHQSDRTNLASLNPKQVREQTENLRKRHMHFLCEAAKLARLEGENQSAETFLQQASEVNSAHPRVPYELSLVLEEQGKKEQAFACLLQFIEAEPHSTIYLLDRIKALAASLGQTPQLTQLLHRHYLSNPSLKVLAVLCEFEQDEAAIKTLWKQHLDQSKSILAAHEWLRLEFAEKLQREENQNVLIVLDNADAPLLRYRCQSCGFETKDFFWQCPGCLDWDSYPPNPIGAQ